MDRLSKSPIVSRLAREPAGSLLLFLVNALVCRELFSLEYGQYLDSIEGAYIGLSRWILERPGEWSWFPLWYGGVPFQNAYPPLLHFLVAGAAAAGGISTALSHHAVTAVLYCLGPVFLYWFAWRLSGERWPAFAAAWLYSLVSPAALLVPEIARDVGSALGARRLHVLVRYGEGPHVASMTLLPLALLALHWALRRRRPLPVLAAAAALASVVLTNWLGGFALAAGVMSYLAAMWIRRPAGMLGWAGGIGLIAYALASPWIPPSTILAVRNNAQHVVGSYPLGGKQAVAGLAAAGGLAALWWWMRRRRAPPAVQFAALWSAALGVLVLPWFWFRFHLMPQPDRYHTELEMGLALLAGFGLAALPRRAIYLAAAALAAFSVVQFANYRRAARTMIRPIDIGRTVEFEAGRWLDQNLPGRRIFVAGSTRMWLAAFADNPQLGGGFDQGITNPVIPAIQFGVPFTREDGEQSSKWLRAFGIDAIVVGGAKSRDSYRDYRDPSKFEGCLPVLWRDGDDAIYEVPRRSRSLAHVIRPEDVVPRPPVNALDVDVIERYHAALEDPSLPVAELEWEGTDTAWVRADLAPGHLLSVQITHHPGWRAEAEGRLVPIRPDGLGLMVMTPECAGTCVVRLTYDGGREMKLARAACAAALAGPFLVFLIRRRRR